MGFGRDFFGAATAALPQGVQLGVRGIEYAQKQKEDDRANLIAKEKLGLLKKVDKRQAKLLQMKIEDDKLNNLTKSLAKTSDPRERNNLIFQFRHTNADNERMSAATQVFDEFSIEQIKKLDGFNKIIELSKKGLKKHEEGAQAHMDRKALYTANSQDYPVEYIEYDRYFGLNDPVLNARNIAKQTADFKEDQKEAGRAQAALALGTLSVNLQHLKSVVNPKKSLASKKTLHMIDLGAKPDADRAAIINAISKFRDGMRKSEQSSEAADTVLREVFNKFGVNIGEFPSAGVASYGTLEKTAEANRQKETADQKALRLQRNDTAERQKQSYEFKKTKYKMGYLSLIPQVEENLSKVLKGYPILQGKTPEELLKVEAGHGESKPWFWFNTPGLTVANARLIHNLVKEIMGYKQAIKEIDDARNIGKGNINFNALTTTTK